MKKLSAEAQKEPEEAVERGAASPRHSLPTGRRRKPLVLVRACIFTRMSAAGYVRSVERGLQVFEFLMGMDDSVGPTPAKEERRGAAGGCNLRCQDRKVAHRLEELENRYRMVIAGNQ